MISGPVRTRDFTPGIPFWRSRRTLGAFTALVILGGCGKDSSGPTIGPPSQLIVSTGANQSAPAGSTLAPITVRVADQAGLGVSGQNVTIAVTEGGGQVTPVAGTTDANGEVTGIVWTLGKAALPQILTVTSGTITGSVTATVGTAYGVTVRYLGGDPNQDVRLAFSNSAARIRGAVIGALNPVPFTNRDLSGTGTTACDVPVTLNETVDGMLIFASVKPIDGAGKILGRAGPCFIRQTSRLTAIGIMEFDSEDLDSLAASGRLEAVILHEMLHVVGVGTLWDFVTPSLLAGAGTPDPRFLGGAAINACTAAGGTSLCAGGVAVENCVGIPGCGEGTRDGHWREGTSSLPGFHTELMTGYIERRDTPMPFSNITIQSLGDLGYTVNALAADPYNVPPPTLRAIMQPGGSNDVPQWERLRHPSATVSRSGTITPIGRQ